MNFKHLCILVELLLYTEEPRSLALVTTCICYCTLHSAWHMHGSRAHAGCRATAFMEQTEKLQLKQGKTSPKPSLLYLCIYWVMQAPEILQSNQAACVCSGGGVHKPGSSVALIKTSDFHQDLCPWRQAVCQARAVHSDTRDTACPQLSASWFWASLAFRITSVLLCNFILICLQFKGEVPSKLQKFTLPEAPGLT